jgi:methylated-DNA-[protein]-cysteine S-methyltransferase
MQSMRPGHTLVDTALGAIGIAWSERGLTRLQLPGSDTAETERRLTAPKNGFAPAECAPSARVALETLLPPPILELARTLRRYAGGDAVDFDPVPLDLPGIGGFRRAIYREARKLRFGETITYGQLAERAGHAGKARETGQAMGSNRVPIVVPCHRVLAAGGAIGGFSAPGGTRTKLRLLELEGALREVPASGQASFGF